MNSEDLRPVLLSRNRYGTTSIPEGRMSFHSPSQIPIVSRRGSTKNVPLSMRDIMGDKSMLSQKLKSLSQNSDFKTNLKFLKYKFNPNGEEEETQITQGHDQHYGQKRQGSREKISINIFQERKNVLFQDERAPLLYKKLFQKRQQEIN